MRRVLRRILSRDRPAAGIRYNGSTLKSLPRYRGLLAIALLSLARRESYLNFHYYINKPSYHVIHARRIFNTRAAIFISPCLTLNHVFYFIFKILSP